MGDPQVAGDVGADAAGREVLRLAMSEASAPLGPSYRITFPTAGGDVVQWALAGFVLLPEDSWRLRSDFGVVAPAASSTEEDDDRG